MSSINLTTINEGLGELVQAVPILSTAYNLYKIIWMRTNPGMTEADYLNHLQTSSQSNIDDTTTILKADGYTEDPPGSGNWKAPAKPA